MNFVPLLFHYVSFRENERETHQVGGKRLLFFCLCTFLGYMFKGLTTSRLLLRKSLQEKTTSTHC